MTRADGWTHDHPSSCDGCRRATRERNKEKCGAMDDDGQGK